MIAKNLLKIFKSFFFQFISITFLISFLLFLLNILFLISFNLKTFSQDLKDRLWIFFYIKESVQEKDALYSKTIDLKTELENNWLEVEYYSKWEALKTLEKRMPEIINNFKEYGIDNPLPPTLYVIFDSKEKYNKLKEIVAWYKNIIDNIEDVGEWKSFSDQEKRVSNVIDLSNFLVVFSYFLIVILVLIIISFLILIIKISFYNFYSQIEIEKLLWAYYRQIKAPYLFKIVLILFFAFCLMLLFMYIFFCYINWYFVKVFDFEIIDYVFSNRHVLYLIGMEIVFIFVLSLLISDFFLKRLIKKV